MLNDQEIFESKNPLCELCQIRFKLPDATSRIGGGKRLPGGMYVCNACLPSINITKKYINFQKGHITENERLALARSRTIRSGKMNWKTSDNYGNQ